MQTPRKQRNQAGFSLGEVVLFIAALCGIVLYSLPQIRTLKTSFQQVKRDNVIAQIESAKNTLDQDGKSADKKKFDSGSDEARFLQLAPLLGINDPVLFVAGSGISKLRINKLGHDVEVE